MSIQIPQITLSFLTNGTINGTFRVSDNGIFVTNALATLTADGVPSRLVRIQNLSGNNTITVVDPKSQQPVDVSAFSIKNNAAITILAQNLPNTEIFNRTLPSTKTQIIASDGSGETNLSHETGGLTFRDLNNNFLTDLNSLIAGGNGGSYNVIDQHYFIGSGPNASDTNSGLSPSLPFATLAHAQSVLGSVAGSLTLLPGTYNAPATGFEVYADQYVIGAGGRAQINGSTVTSAPYVVRVGGPRSILGNLWVINVPANTVGVRVTWNGIGSTTEDVRLDNLLVGLSGANSIAYGIGDDTNLDVSAIVLTNCVSDGDGSTTTHMVLGNGGAGNVLSCTNIGGDSQVHKYGIILNGGTLMSYGLDFEASGIADIWLKNPGIGNNTIMGGRSENPYRFIVSTMGSFGYSTIAIRDYTVVQLHNTDGQGIQLTGIEPIELDNIFINGATCPQYISTTKDPAGDTIGSSRAHITNFNSDHVYPFRSPWNRAGTNFITRGTNFIGAPGFQNIINGDQTKWTRRYNVTTNANFSLNPYFFDNVEIRLSANAGTFALSKGAYGQQLSIAFVEDGVGSWSYTWPTNCGFSGGTPANVTTAKNRQSCTFTWNGTFWEQNSLVTNIIPPTPSSIAVSDNFATGNPYWLDLPSSGGTRSWEMIPGGGSVGIVNGVCATNSFGYLGDSGSTQSSSGLFGNGVGAVIETGMATTAIGISATFKYFSGGAGIAAHYLDDQNFYIIYLDAGLIFIDGFVNGIQKFFQFVTGLAIADNTTTTLLVKCTATGFDISINGGSVTTITLGATNMSLSGGNTKHGIVSFDTRVTFSAFSVS